MLAQVSCCRGACSDSRGIAFLRGVHEAPAMALRCCKGAAYARAVLTTPAPCEHEGAYLGVHVSCDCMRSYVPGDVATSALQQVFQATPSWGFGLQFRFVRCAMLAIVSGASGVPSFTRQSVGLQCSLACGLSSNTSGTRSAGWFRFPRQLVTSVLAIPSTQMSLWCLSGFKLVLGPAFLQRHILLRHLAQPCSQQCLGSRLVPPWLRS